jgi:predicted nucleotidyltransferase
MPTHQSVVLLRKLRGQRSLFPRYGVRKLEIFGSVARGKATRRSDLDLIATFRRNPGLRLIEFHRKLETALGVPVDLLDAQTVLEMTNPYRRNSINASRHTVYEDR